MNAFDIVDTKLAATANYERPKNGPVPIFGWESAKASVVERGRSPEKGSRMRKCRQLPATRQQLYGQRDFDAKGFARRRVYLLDRLGILTFQVCPSTTGSGQLISRLIVVADDLGGRAVGRILHTRHCGGCLRRISRLSRSHSENVRKPNLIDPESLDGAETV
jgi:hypothetical protein